MNTAWAAALSMVLAPFGSVPELLQKGSPWRGFATPDPEQGAVLLIARAEHVATPACGRWLDALVDDPAGTLVGAGSLAWPEALKAWEPYTEKEKETITDCDDLPCKIKFNAAEVKRMAAVKSVLRVDLFHNLVVERAKNYEATGVRKEYEFPGDPVDPWPFLEKYGFRSSLKRPEKTTLWVRKIDFAPDKVQALRQVLDRRAALSSKEATVWIRDAYTDHYFDGWGAWSDIACDENGQGLTIVQAMLVELDLLKETGLMYRIGRGRMRSAMEQSGGAYLDGWFARIKKRAEANK